MDKKEVFDKCNSNKNLLKESVFAKTFPLEYQDISTIDFQNDMTFQQKLYHWFKDDYIIPKCETCGNPVKFINVTLGYRHHCCVSCSRKDESVQNKMYETSIKKYGNYCNRKKTSESLKHTYLINKENIIKKSKNTKKMIYGDENYNNIQKRKETCKNKYGVDSYSKTEEFNNKIRQTKKDRYNDEFYTNRELCKKTMMNKYGVEYSFELDHVKEKIKQTNLEKYGVENVFASDEIKEKIKQTNLEKYGVENVFTSDEIKEKIKQTNLEKYGVNCPTKCNLVKEKIAATNIEKYGVEWYCMTDDCRSKSSNDSVPNRQFAKLLDFHHIIYEREFKLEKYSYDFKVNDVLIEINPTITHNVKLNVFGRTPIENTYHLNKTNVANKNGYKCIHVWDWDDADKIVNMLKPKKTLYARNLILKEVSEKECNEFLNLYHLQNTCKGQTVRYGLYKDDLLVMIMTFGKPRYNKNYEYELLRLCSHKDYKIVGGAEKIFKYILNIFKLKSIISYCDNSKFSGSVYEKLGFEKQNSVKLSKHWYNIKTKQHITDNFLRQHGFDQLFGTGYGKGTSNEELMIKNKFLPVYDCGQIVFTLIF